MCWGKSVTRIPHVFELIFSFLDPKDLITASEVCQQWETVVFGSRQLSGRLAWNIFKPCYSKKRKKSRLRFVKLRKKDRYSTQQLIDMEQVLASTRLLNGVVVAPRVKYAGDWTNAIPILEQINRQNPVCWLRIDGTYDKEIISSRTIFSFGRILSNLRHLELSFTIHSFFQPDYASAFEQFTNLESLVLDNGHVIVLRSIRSYCHRLRKLVLNRFAFSYPLDDLLNFAELEELVIEYMDFFPWYIGESQIEVPKLKILTMCKLSLTEELNIPPITIKAPLLEKAHISDMLHPFVQLEYDNLHTFTLNVVSCPRKVLSPSMFHGRLGTVTEVIIETQYLKIHQLAMAMAWVKQQCPRVTRLVFVQQKVPPLEKIRSFATMEIPSLKQIVHRRPGTETYISSYKSF